MKFSEAMIIDYLKKEADNTRLILIMAGWNAGPEVAAGIELPGWDVAVAHDYSHFNIDNEFLDSYYTVYVFAWSMGVFAAEMLLPKDRITAAYAINGTLTPVNDMTGIPETIFLGTLDNLNERNLYKFRIRISGNRAIAQELTKSGNTDIVNLKDQLVNIREYQNRNLARGKARLPWVRAYISDHDKIFPPENQKRAWAFECDTEVINITGEHFADLRNIIRSVIPDIRTVSQRFKKATSSYDTHAIAQYSAAIKLAGQLNDMGVKKGLKILEIGCGTGLFTREYARSLTPTEVTFVDITETGPFGIAENEEYIVADAEKWITDQSRRWDAIVSASAIQWFADIPRFLHECSIHLNPEGIIAISTFVPGNMEELDSLRPSPLRYPTSTQLIEWMQRDFKEVTVREDIIRVEFQSAREMLMHLKHTGVGGSSPSTTQSIKDFSNLRSLTYRPVYVTGKLKTADLPELAGS